VSSCFRRRNLALAQEAWTCKFLVDNKVVQQRASVWIAKFLSNIGYFRVFGCKCFILNTKDNLGNFDSKSDDGIFRRYSSPNRAYKVFNKYTMSVEESIHVNFQSWS